MTRKLILILFFILGIFGVSQAQDSLIAVRRGATWQIRYTVKPFETVHMLATRFYISDGVLEYANDPDILKKLSAGTVINIPVTKENYSQTKLPLDGLHELYCHVGPKEDMAIISTYTGITKDQMRKWNNLKGNTVTVGQTLFIGWVKVMDRDSNDPSVESAYPSFKKAAIPDTGKVIVAGGLDTLYDTQTNRGMSVLTEKGTAVFFEKTGKSNVFVAFHNTARRGTVIKVFNPGTNKTIYVKVLGPIPNTKLYANSIIGINEAAKEALGVTETKAWCELSYSPN